MTFDLDSVRRFILTPARKERLAYFRSVPLKRLSVLAAAAFFLFATIGLLSALSSGETRSPAGLAWGFFSGLVAVVYLLIACRKPILLPAAIAVQLLCNFGMIRTVQWIDRTFPAEDFHTLVRVYAISTIVLTCVAYTLFLIFIQTEGRFAFRAQTELALAHGIQQTLAPVIHTIVAGCEIYGISVPSEKVGGDLVDVVALPDGSAFAYVADIAGHGLQAGILMGMVKTAARTKLVDMPAPGVLFDSLNRVLPGVKEAHMYATCAALHLLPSPGLGCGVEYALAGHPAILHLSESGNMRGELADEQFPLGLIPAAVYRSQFIQAASGDLLVATTDGVLEVCDKQGLEFGVEGLQRVLSVHAKEPLPELAREVLAAVNKFGRQYDDQTLLLIRVL